MEGVITILIILWINEYNMTIDVEREYGIKNREACNFIQSTEIQEYSDNQG